ncbi:DNA topoisomerase 3-alpha [Scaptodrosophila lebanonensis]|uniref:DNA topoisomerase n=1 Tax=Drosophila lebanonensis TaxID=7225 RepID=A0A6J2TM38_DROLE|nr:DNA topoisomerase 3-alpha [Scaptodrosophila lebanonensis]
MKYLNVAEKHDAAKTIANLLSQGSARRREGYSVYNKVFDFEAQVRGQNAKMVMTSVSGHLMHLEFLVSYRNWRTVDPSALFDAPVRKAVAEDYQPIKRTLEREVRGCQGLIIWTDCDREGENIGFEVVDVCRAIKPNLTVYRASFSEITTVAVRRALQQLGPPDKRQSDAVDVRTELDLRTGAAITRFQTMRLQRLFPQGIADKLISYGSCQIPTLGFVVERYKEVEAFVSEPFWKIRVLHTIEDLTVEFNWARNRLFDKEACENYLVLCLSDPRAKVESVTVKPKHKWRPTAMDTVEMEKLGSRKLKLSAKETMSIAEKLYTKGFISYPRTETNQFSKEFNLTPLVEQQTGHDNWGAFAQRVLEWGPSPRNGNKSDQAHPPIHPTKLVTNLAGNEARVYELIVRHFLACVSKDAVGSETIVNIDIAGEKFSANGLVIHERNYLDVYVYDKWSAKQIHHYEQGQVFEPTEIALHEGATTAPPLLTEADLIALMEKHGIGTDATHAEHINTIKERGYIGVVDKGAIVPGVIGMGLYEGYDAMELALAKPLLRAEFEADLKRICLGEKDPKLVLSEQIQKYKQAYQQIMDKITAMDEKIAQRLNEAPTAGRGGNANDDNGGGAGGGVGGSLADGTNFIQQLYECPKCKVAPLALKPKKNQTGYFIGCLNYPDCKNVVWLPDECKEPSVLDEHCERCGANYKLLKFKLSSAYYRTLFKAPYGWYKTCLRCDGQFRSTFNINVDSVKAVGGIVGEAPRQAPARTNRPGNDTQPKAKVKKPPPPGSSGTETQAKSKKSSTTTASRGRAAGNLRSYFTASSTRGNNNITSTGSDTVAFDDFFNSNDGFDQDLLTAAAMAESSGNMPPKEVKDIADAALIDDIAAAFAADDDADFEALLNVDSNAQPPPSPPPGGVATTTAAATATAAWPTADLDTSLTSWMRHQYEAEEEPMTWGTKGRSTYAAATVPPAAKRPRLSNEWQPNDNDDDAGTATGSVVLCSGCHQPARGQIVRKDGPNKGRSFYRCPKSNQCKFFQWADEQPASSANSATPNNTWGTRNATPPTTRESSNYSWGSAQTAWGSGSRNDAVENNSTPPTIRESSNYSWGSAQTAWASGSRNDAMENNSSKTRSNNNETYSWGSGSGSQSSTSNWSASRSNFNGTMTITKTAHDTNAVQCKCNKPASSLTVRKDGPNQGRPFYACPNREKSCGFFQWGDVDGNQASTSKAAAAPSSSQNQGSRDGSSSGSGNRARRCGLCRQEGHTKNKCPRKSQFEY